MINYWADIIPELEIIDHELILAEDSGKAFTGFFGRTMDPIAVGQTNIFVQMGIQSSELMKAGFQDYFKTMQNFENGMLDIVTKFKSGSYNYTKSVSLFKSLSGDSYKKFFIAGAKAVGNEFYDKLPLTRKDLQFLGRARRAEMRFFKGLLNDIENPKHLRPSQIPRNAAGKRLPGYRAKMHSYTKRATSYFPATGKSQFYNGMVAGVGSQVDIFWVLGVPQLEHCHVCPQFSRVRWSWKTLPTTPRAGDTPCLFRCYCHLKFEPKAKGLKTLGGDPARGIQYGLGGGSQAGGEASTIGQAGKVVKKSTGDPVSANKLSNEHNMLRQQMNKARQMIDLPLNKEDLAFWIKTRRGYNQKIINMQKANPELRFLPTNAVKDLSATVLSAASKGGAVLPRGVLPAVGDEIVFVRGLYADIGIVQMRVGGISVSLPNGNAYVLDPEIDTFFVLKKATESKK